MSQSKYHFKIAANSGIGDSLYLLSYLFPIQSYYNNNKDFRVFITYSQTYNNCGHSDLIQDFVSRISYAEWVDFEDFDKLDLPELTWREKKSDFVEEFIKGHSPTQIEFSLNSDEKELISAKFFEKPYVFIQLSSNSPQRIWNRANYEILINKLLETTDYNVILSDWPNSSGVNIQNDRIKTFYGCNLALAVELVRKCSLLISTCSWNKYVASLESIPRIILCANVIEMGQQLGFSDKVGMLNHLYEPVIMFPKHKLLGITNEKIENGRFLDADIIEHVNKITPEEVLSYVGILK